MLGSLLGSVEPKHAGFAETQALDEKGKAVVGFLQVDEDEEGIAVGFEIEPSKQSNLASNPVAAGFLQCWVQFRTQQALCSSWVPAGAGFEGAGFDFEPSRHWV
ncbi:hypothetical protein SLEP1_g16294 [Rubroshorea leprosula]|uniref:Uncharacterized protein n=1 Tax=Rubroshorea leprosula TaxID=152421 RepID=A0AAV5IQF6_9ROSI|nr:hypothetical protein SLEP1_g16294 [Rubroshorea leprosula]